MKLVLLFLALSVTAPAFAQNLTPCEQQMSSIITKYLQLDKKDTNLRREVEAIENTLQSERDLDKRDDLHLKEADLKWQRIGVESDMITLHSQYDDLDNNRCSPRPPEIHYAPYF